MRERTDEFLGCKSLYVYPYMTDEQSDAFMAAAGNVEGMFYHTDDGKLTSGVRINVALTRPCSREDTDKLKAAIDRCWQWIDENTEDV